MVSLQLAKMEDFDFFYQIKCENSNIFWTGHDKRPDYEELKHFFEKCIRHQAEADARKIYIILHGSVPVGHLYLIPNNFSDEKNRMFDLAPAILEKYWRHGYAKEAIRLGLEKGKSLGFTEMRTSIREDNGASLQAFQSCGVQITDEFKMVYIPMLGREVKMFIVKKKL